jgi:hypothetical protein
MMLSYKLVDKLFDCRMVFLNGDYQLPILKTLNCIALIHFYHLKNMNTKATVIS